MKTVGHIPLMLLALFPIESTDLWAQQADVQVFAQVFHLDDRNTSTISVQNPGLQEISVSVEFLNQQGGLLAEETRDLPARSSAEFAGASAGTFVGVAIVSCAGCLATARWSFAVGNAPRFEVGVLPQLLSNRSRIWAAPVPVITEGSSYGFAIYNPSRLPADCDFIFRDVDGLPSGSELVTVTGGGHFSQFSEAIGKGFVGSAILSCDQEVISVGVNQDTRNGFPTSLNYASVPSGTEAREP